VQTAGAHRRSASACLLRIRRSNGSIAPWSFLNGNRAVEAIVRAADCQRFSHHAWRAIEGMGLAQVPGPIAAGPTKAGKLVHVLKPFEAMAPGVFLTIPAAIK